MSLRTVSVLLMAGSSVLLAGQQPTFRTEINYVELHVSVVAKDGQYVAGLTKADFQVRESGAPQVVASVEEIALPMPTPRDAGRLEPDGSVADAGLAAEGRVYAIVIDRSHLDASSEPKLQKQLAEFVDDFVSPADLVAVVNLGGAVTTPFTSNKARLRAALGVGGGRRETESIDGDGEIAAGFTKAESARDATTTLSGFDAIADLARFLRGFEGRRKAVVYVSGGVNVRFGTASSGTGVAPEQMVDQNAVAGSYKRMIESLLANNITIYSIDPKGLATFDPFGGGGRYAASVEMLRGIADDTGGISIVGFNDLTRPYERIVADNSHYYVIGYVSNRPADGKRHSIAVDVNRLGVDVRARREIQAASSKAKPDPALSGWRKTDVASLLTRAVPTADPGLRLRVTASAVSWRDGKSVVQLTTEIHEGGLALSRNGGVWTNDVVVGFQAIDEQGKPSVAKSETVKLRVSAQTRDAISDRGWRHVTEFELPRGVFQLRVAASESNAGRSGSAFLDLAIPDARKSPLAVIGLALASDSARLTPTAGAAPTVRPLGSVVVTGSRMFASSETLTTIAAVIDAVPGDHSAQISASLVDANGRVAKQVSESVASKDLRAGAGPRALTLPLMDAAAGDYTLVVKAEAAGKSARRSLVISVVK